MCFFYISILPVTPPLTHTPPTLIQTSTSPSSDSISTYPSIHPLIHIYEANHPSVYLPTEPLTGAPLTYYPPPLTQHSLRGLLLHALCGRGEGWGLHMLLSVSPHSFLFLFLPDWKTLSWEIRESGSLERWGGVLLLSVAVRKHSD